MKRVIKVSVIIPVYNVEKYLSKCLDGVISQTLKDIEIICVDDGSTDSSLDILNGYALKDNRIKIVHKENSGYGNTMNIGINIAKGEYIGIVESDDYILPGMYGILYENAKKNNLDLIKSDYYIFWDTLNYKSTNHFTNLENYYNRVLDNTNRDIYFKFWISNCTGIYKREFINKNNIRYQDTSGASYQDVGFWLQAMSVCERAMWIDEPFYMYRQDNPDSSIKNKGKMMAVKGEYDFVERILREKNLESELKICNYYRMAGHKYTFYRIDDLLKREYADIIKKDYDKYKEDIEPKENSEYLSIMNWVKDVSENPDKVCSDTINLKAEVSDVLKNCEKIILYGAGKRAETVILKIYNLGFYDNITYIAVSQKGTEDKLMNISIKNIEDLLNYKNNLVLVAVKKESNAYSEIANKLKDYGFNNFTDTETFLKI